MTDDSEIKGGIDTIEAVDTVDYLIAEARRITGIDPGHERYCADCHEVLPVKGGDLCKECGQ
jgi:hypothetical protein